ncbi:MAG: von Willebrand factor type A domain-containing protein [Candidatus Marinimicrobia bacterium]|nr:von Willebrand factor type A domain-containing protein [Candidatus Neomarinimicrobiota bacterium]
MIRGRVTDFKNNPLTGAQVFIECISVGTMCDRDGNYIILNVPVGTYDVEVAMIGYRNEIKSNIVVTEGDSTLVNFQLIEQPIQGESVEMRAWAPKIERGGTSLAMSHSPDSFYLLSDSGTHRKNSQNKQYRRSQSSNYFDKFPKDFNTEGYDYINENTFKDVKQNPLSTFSIDVDNASYSNVRRLITDRHQLPPKDAVRIEELINYFTYDYPQPEGKDPFSIITEISECPWNEESRLIHIGLQGREVDYENLKPSNLVFLIDVSGSMSDQNKLPLLKKSFKLLVNSLDDHDRIAIVVYASSSGEVLSSTPVYQKDRIMTALDKLRAGGSTAGGEGIQLAYQIAKENYIKNGNNRVILATDGDFNVGVSNTADLVQLIEDKRKDGIYLTITGFGMGNYKDDKMEQLSNAGNGNYFYIDNIKEAEKVFVKEMRANLFTIAKDVKIQIEFNPANIKAYRLIGYENRALANENFNDDKKDAGELGAGHTVTVLYEVIPAGFNERVKLIDELRYQQNIVTEESYYSSELATVKLRYKKPGKDVSKSIHKFLYDSDISLFESSDNFRFSAAVAGFGMLLRDSEFKGELTYQQVISMAKHSKGKDENGNRNEFIRMVESCQLLN